MGLGFFFSPLLKDKLRHIKIFRSLFEQKGIQVGSARPEVVRSVPPMGAQGETLILSRSEVRKLLIGYHLKPSWLFVIGHP